MGFERIRKYSVLAIVLLAMSTASLYANPISLRLSDGTTTVTVTDGGAGDANSAVGAITFIGSVGVFTINVSTGIGTQVPGPSVMDLNSINISSGAGTLTVSFSEQNLSLLPAFIVSFGGTLTAPAGSSVSGSVYVDQGNALFANTTLIDSLGPFGPGAFSAMGGGSASLTGNYSMTANMVIVATGPTTYSGDLNIAPVPEPSSVLLFGTGLAGLAIWARRKTRS